MNSSPALLTHYDRPMRIALIVGIVAAVISVAGLFISGAGLFFQAYLFAFVFWIGISLGSLALLLLHFVAGSRWGLTIRRITEAASGSIWVMALLFIPLLVGLPYLYIWARPADVAVNTLLQNKTWYLNVPFFIIRAVIYFIIWGATAYFANRHAARLSDIPHTSLVIEGRGQGASAFGLILYVLTMSFASIDWLMSLQPEWNSTAFGFVIILSQVLTALAFAVLMLNLFPSLSQGRRWNYRQTPIPFRDLGSLLLTFIMGWTYVAFFQLLIQWAGNIPREVVWYATRSQGGWDIIAILITIFEFALPFAILLSIRARHDLRVLAWLGGMLMVVFLINMFWHVKPVFSPVLSISLMDITLPIAIGGLWVAAFLFHLKRRPALSEIDQASIIPVSEPEEAA